MFGDAAKVLRPLDGRYATGAAAKLLNESLVAAPAAGLLRLLEQQALAVQTLSMAVLLPAGETYRSSVVAVCDIFDGLRGGPFAAPCHLQLTLNRDAAEVLASLACNYDGDLIATAWLQAFRLGINLRTMVSNVESFTQNMSRIRDMVHRCHREKRPLSTEEATVLEAFIETQWRAHP